ncbi:MAG: efflux transporter outer membrane subunit [Stenotrophobium sp.]
MRKHPPRCLSLLLFATVAGCASMGNNSPTPLPRDANTLDAGRDIAQARSDDAAWPTATWWQTFGDPQLDALVTGAIAGNPGLAAAQARIAQAQAAASGARAATLPSAQASAAFTYTRFSEQQFFPPPYAGNFYWNSDAQIDLGYDLDLWGRNRSALAAALDGVQISACEAQAVRLALEGAVVRAYAGLSYQYALDQNFKAILRDQQLTRDIAQRRLAAGIGTDLDVQQAQTAIASTQAQLEQVDAQMQILRHQLAALAGNGPGSGDDLTPPALHFSQAAALPRSIPAQLVGLRPDLVAQRWRVERAARDIDVAKTAFYPDINLAAVAGVLSLNFSKLLSGSAAQAGIGPAISLPLFDGGRLRANLQSRRAEYDGAVADYDATLVAALEDVADHISALRSLALQSQQRNAALASAQRAHTLALKAFRAGLTDYLNVLSAQSALNTQRGLVAEIQFRQLLAAAGLNQALGGGLMVRSDEHAPTAPAPDHADEQ